MINASRSWMLVPAVAASLFMLGCEQIEPFEEEAAQAVLSETAGDGCCGNCKCASGEPCENCKCGDCKCAGDGCCGNCKCASGEPCENCKCAGGQGCSKAEGQGCSKAEGRGCPFAVEGEIRPCCGRRSRAGHGVAPSP